MKRSELMLKLRLDFNNYIRKDYMKDKCEKCGSNENLHVHHIITFKSQFEHILELMNISSKEEFNDNEVELIKLEMFGSQYKNNHYVTLCKNCHIDKHLELKYGSNMVVRTRIMHSSGQYVKVNKDNLKDKFIEYIRNNWTNKLIYTKDQKDEIISYAHDLGMRKSNGHKHTFNSLVTLMKEYDINIDKRQQKVNGKNTWVIEIR